MESVLRCLLPVGVLLCLLVCRADGTSAQLKALQDEFWLWRMETNPSYARYLGYTQFANKSFSYDYRDFDVHRARTQAFVTQLDAIDVTSLSGQELVNHEVLNDTLSTYLEGSLWALYGSLSPISFLGGLHLSTSPGMAATSTKLDYDNYITLLGGVKQQVEDIIEMGRLAIALNRTLHNVSMEKVPGQFDERLVENATDAPAYSPFMDRLNDTALADDEKDDIRSRGLAAVSVFLQAQRDLRAFIVNEYMPNARTEYGVHAWDPTGDFYRACLKWHLSFEMSPEDVHATGLEEVERISGEMLKIMQGLGFQGSVREFFESLENDPRFYSNDTDKILAAYNTTVFERINPELDGYFKNIPNVPLRIRASSSDGIGGGYSAATETSPGTFIINLYRPLEVPFFEMMALSLHEANPGHHMQHSYSMLADLPDFRKNDILSFYNPPNFFPFYSAYSEGWGLYSEYLGEEMDLYSDEYEMMGRYSYEILRAVRLVVDTGMHYYKWSRERALEYMGNYTSLAPGSAANEIDRYITWPGQACAYKLGEIRMKQLRRQAETDLGALFDLKDFHLLVLEKGGMPLRTLEAAVDEWTQSILASRSNGANSAQGSLPRILVIALVLMLAMHLLRRY